MQADVTLFETQFMDELAYVNIVSKEFPLGDIGGWILQRPAIMKNYTLRAKLTAASVVGGSSTSNASATAVLTMDTETRLISYTVDYVTPGEGRVQRVSLHGFSLPGARSRELVDVRSSGSFPFTEMQAIGFIEGRTYIQMYTDAFPQGEIRGQVIASGGPALIVSPPLLVAMQCALLIFFAKYSC